MLRCREIVSIVLIKRILCATLTTPSVSPNNDEKWKKISIGGLLLRGFQDI